MSKADGKKKNIGRFIAGQRNRFEKDEIQRLEELIKAG